MPSRMIMNSNHQQGKDLKWLFMNSWESLLKTSPNYWERLSRGAKCPILVQWDRTHSISDKSGLGTFLGVGDAAVNKTKISILVEFTQSFGGVEMINAMD